MNLKNTEIFHFKFFFMKTPLHLTFVTFFYYNIFRFSVALKCYLSPIFPSLTDIFGKQIYEV